MAAAASFRTEIDSISFGSMPLKSCSTPSTITKGLSKPRIFNCSASLPGAPVDCLVINPGNNPGNAAVVLATGATIKSSLVTEETDPVTFTFFSVP